MSDVIRPDPIRLMVDPPVYVEEHSGVQLNGPLLD